MSVSESSPATIDPAAAKYDRLLSRFDAGALPPLIIAIGLDGELLDALDRRGALTKVLAIEPVPVASRQSSAWRDWTASGRLTVLTGPAFEGRAEAWKLIARKAPQPPMIVSPALQQQFPSETDNAKAVARQIVLGAQANEEARKRFAGGYLLNTLANLPVIATEGNASALTDFFAGVPAVLVAAGPSLDKNLAAIDKIKDRALLIAVDTAVRPLQAAGISPHLVVSVDPSEANARHLKDLPDVRGTWLVAEGSLDRQVFAQFAGRTFIYRVSNHDPWPWLAEHGCDRGKLQAWGSVLTTAFDLALRIGCNPIVFAGADLAYTGGLQYCRNTVFEHEWSPFPTDADRAAEFAKYLQARPHFAERDAAGREVVTAPHFVQFRDWLVSQANSASPRRIINATGGGILHGGRIEHVDINALSLAARPDHGRDLRGRLHAAWTASTAAHAGERERIERALAYGEAVPFRGWLEFGGDTATREQIVAAATSAAESVAWAGRKIAYLAMQREYYDSRMDSLEAAQRMSHGHYEHAQRQAPARQAHLLLDFLQRSYDVKPGARIKEILASVLRTPRALRALDLGCGLGRSMEPLVEDGLRVDGVDLSPRMIEFARSNPRFKHSEFFVSRGNDCGHAPDGAYDVAYSQGCFQFICSRTVRQELLRALARALRPGGLVVVDLRVHPKLAARDVPHPHVPWSADNFAATGTRGEADVWPTLDEIDLLYADFAACFLDLRLQFIDLPPQPAEPSRVQLVVSGTTTAELAARLHSPLRNR